MYHTESRIRITRICRHVLLLFKATSSCSPRCQGAFSYWVGYPDFLNTHGVLMRAPFFSLSQETCPLLTHFRPCCHGDPFPLHQAQTIHQPLRLSHARPCAEGDMFGGKNSKKIPKTGWIRYIPQGTADRESD